MRVRRRSQGRGCLLGCTPSQLIKFLKEAPRALGWSMNAGAEPGGTPRDEDGAAGSRVSDLIVSGCAWRGATSQGKRSRGLVTGGGAERAVSSSAVKSSNARPSAPVPP